ncbi:hypothetical protein HDU76_009202 [Blyttiomyces sp. JEL0837]|nr:hypothetical protein HDU76_009202 [Blyttiomyces sp. JEL0837]
MTELDRGILADLVVEPTSDILTSNSLYETQLLHDDEDANAEHHTLDKAHSTSSNNTLVSPDPDTPITSAKNEDQSYIQLDDLTTFDHITDPIELKQRLAQLAELVGKKDEQLIMAAQIGQHLLQVNEKLRESYDELLVRSQDAALNGDLELGHRHGLDESENPFHDISNKSDPPRLFATNNAPSSHTLDINTVAATPSNNISTITSSTATGLRDRIRLQRRVL